MEICGVQTTAWEQEILYKSYKVPSELYKISGALQREGGTDAFLDNFRENNHILPIFVKTNHRKKYFRSTAWFNYINLIYVMFPLIKTAFWKKWLSISTSQGCLS